MDSSLMDFLVVRYPTTIIGSVLSTFGFGSSFGLEWFVAPPLKPYDLAVVLAVVLALLVTLDVALFFADLAICEAHAASCFVVHTIHGQAHLIGHSVTITSTK